MTETVGAWGDGGQPPSSSAVSSPWARVVQPRVNACDGWPECRWEGTGRDLKLHRRECPKSRDGEMYRFFRAAGHR